MAADRYDVGIRHTAHCDARRAEGDGLCECGALRRDTLLVCGTRDAPETQAAYVWVLAAVDDLAKEHGARRLAHGGARGVDSLADKAAEALGLYVAAYPADWKTHGKAAGPLRNRQMMREERPAVVLAYPRGGPGTADMIAVAKAAGALVVER